SSSGGIPCARSRVLSCSPSGRLFWEVCSLPTSRSGFIGSVPDVWPPAESGCPHRDRDGRRTRGPSQSIGSLRPNELGRRYASWGNVPTTAFARPYGGLFSAGELDT